MDRMNRIRNFLQGWRGYKGIGTNFTPSILFIPVNFFLSHPAYPVYPV
jgi:hypothetical protein